MIKPDKIPPPVLETIKGFCERYNPNLVDFLAPKNFQWDGLMGCYTFEHGGMFYGVETDGYLHS